MSELTQREKDLLVFAISFLQANLDDALDGTNHIITEDELILLEQKVLES
jgi:hypothetical protein